MLEELTFGNWHDVASSLDGEAHISAQNGPVDVTRLDFGIQ